MKRYLAGVVTGFSFAALFVWLLAGPGAHGEIAPTGYSVEDIFQFVVSNGGTNPIEKITPWAHRGNKACTRSRTS